MPRVVAAAVALALFALQSGTGAFHTHAPGEGHGPDHRHGPAIHYHEEHENNHEEHEDTRARHDVDALHVEGVESTPRVITLTVPAATAAAGVVLFTVKVSVFARPMLFDIGCAPIVATRNHDPPNCAPRSLRGPPHILTV